MTFVCNILYFSMFENVSNCNIITPKRETCFEKSEVLTGFKNDISKSRNREFCSSKSGEGRTHDVSYQVKEGHP